MDIKTEPGISSVANETSSPHTSDWLASVKVKSEVPDEDGTSETGNSADFFEWETDQTREIKTEGGDVNSAEIPSPEEFNATSNPVLENHVIIKKEEDLGLDDEVSLGIVGSNDTSSLEDENKFDVKCDQPTTSQDEASSEWGLYEEDLSVSPPTVAEDKPLGESRNTRAHYHSHGFKLAHVSVSLKDVKSEPSTHIVEKQFSCSHCSAKFNKSYNLKTHMRIHTGEKPYSCKYCSAKFRQSTTLKNHLTTHTGEKPFSCTYCSAKFGQSSHLKNHLKTHTGEKPFACTYCPDKFAHKGTLKSHLTIHTGEKPYACEYCPAKFSQSSSLKNHIATHSGKRFLCTYCPAEFSQHRHLKNHVMIHM